MTLRKIVEESLATVSMECGPFTTAELSEFDKIAAGEKTTGQSRTKILADIKTRQDLFKKRRNDKK